MMKTISAVAVALTMMAGVPAWAAEHTVQMLNKDSEGRAMQFEPAFLKVAPGDTVKFVPTDKGHNSETIEGAMPEGAEAWKGKLNEEITVTLTEEGLYAYKCAPHFAMGMVGVIQVGESTENAEAIRGANMPARAKTRVEELLTEAGATAQ
jgi:pseudoazurin